MIYLTFLAGLLLSATAGYYSIIGLLAIFPGAILPITIMGGTLEFAKLVSVSWLYRNWAIAPKLLKGYFLFAVFILMFITSLGTFGYLSKVHLETATSTTDNTVEIQRLENEIASEKQQLDNAQKSITLLDKLVDGNDVTKAVAIRSKQKAERTQLTATIKEASKNIASLNNQLAPLKKENLKVEAEVGPLKYVAELIYGDQAMNHFDSAVRFVIILIVLVFDPLAILLLIAANISMSLVNKKVDNPDKTEYNNGIPNKDSVYNFDTNDDFGINAVDKVNKRGKNGKHSRKT